MTINLHVAYAALLSFLTGLAINLSPTVGCRARTILAGLVGVMAGIAFTAWWCCRQKN